MKIGALLCGVLALAEVARGNPQNFLCGHVLGESPPVPVGPRYGNAQHLRDLYPKVQERIEQTLGVPYHPSFFWGHWGPTEYKVDQRFWRGRLFLFYADVLLGQGSVYTHGDVLRFDIWIDEAFRRGGLYSYLLEEVLRAFPKVRRIPTRMNAAESENAVYLADRMLGSVESYEGWVPEQSSQMRRMEIRQRLLAALPEMPAMKVRTKFGFAKVTKVILNPASGGLALDVERGPPAPQGPRIYLWNPSQELLADGTLVPVSASEVQLDGYPDIQPWQSE